MPFLLYINTNNNQHFQVTLMGITKYTIPPLKPMPKQITAIFCRYFPTGIVLLDAIVVLLFK